MQTHVNVPTAPIGLPPQPVLSPHHHPYQFIPAQEKFVPAQELSLSI
jgi:hypothetical protein